MADTTTSTELLSGAIRFTGLGSGTDFDSMVTKLVDTERIHQRRLEAWKATWEKKTQAFQELNSALLTLRTTLSGMDSLDEFLAKQTVSSNPAALTATASSSAESGAHTVEVVGLAATDTLMGTAVFSAPSADITGGVARSMTLVVGSTQMTVDVAAGTTLQQLADMINAHSQNQNLVRATLINDGSGYRLQLRGMELGAGNDVLIDDGLTTVPGFSSADFVQTQNAANAQLRVDGWPVTPAPTATILQASTGLTAATDPLSGTPGDFKFAAGGTLYTVSLGAGATLQDLVDGINALGSGVSASLATESGSQVLVLTGTPGAANTVRVVDYPGTTLAGLGASAFTQTQGATDGYLERASNSISDIIPGITMNLVQAGQTTTLTTATDVSAVVDKVKTFVDEVNTVLTKIQEQTKVTTVGSQTTGSLLTGNYGLQMIQQRIKNILASKGLGFDRDLDPVTSLGSVGITTDTAQGSPTFGLLVLDETALRSALNTDPQAVASLFAADYVTSTKEMVEDPLNPGQYVAAASPHFQFSSLVRGVTQAGEFSVTYTVSGGSISASPPPTIGGYPASIDGTKITAIGDDNPAKGLVIDVMDMTDGSYSGTIFVKNGKALELGDEVGRLTAPLEGPLKILEDNYQDIIDSIDAKIAYEEKRLTLLESTLRTRFANLEATLGTYDQLSSMLGSQINSLPKNS
jgi:flagellar hook-associated protein 2